MGNLTRPRYGAMTDGMWPSLFFTSSVHGLPNDNRYYGGPS